MKKKVVILGGGAAGWLTALFLQKSHPAIDITVIEDPSTPPIIAGESGSALVNKLYNYLGIPITEWIIETNAMPKLGGRFYDWNGLGTEFIHGLIPDWYYATYNGEFPSYGRDNEFLNCAVAEGLTAEDLYYNAKLQRLGRLPLTESNNPNKLFNVLTLPMFHFDSRANAAYLKRIGISRGITLLEGKYQSCERLPSGGIASLKLDTADKVDADWFFDCSGFARLLLQKELGEPVKDLTDYFPARQVVAWWEDESTKANHTVVTAMKNGWVWNINLRHRLGNGYIFDPDQITEDQAVAEIEERFGKKIDPVARLKFMPALMENCWKENVLAFGLSSGFLEPLESNGLVVVVGQLQLLTEYWSPTVEHNAPTQKIFNKEYYEKMVDVMNFLSLHYRGQREDTDFWRSHKYDAFRIPESLKDRLDIFKAGMLGPNTTAVYGLESYATVAQALDLIDIRKLRDNLLSKRPSILEDFRRHYSVMQQELTHITNICYTVEDWERMIYGSN